MIDHPRADGDMSATMDAPVEDATATANADGPVDRAGLSAAAAEIVRHADAPLPAAGANAADDVRAFLDIGTNSVRVVVVRVAPNHTYTVLVQEKETVRLGENEFIDGYLQADAMQRAAAACAGFVDLARNQGANDIVAVATSATREARNRRDFDDLLLETAGLEVNTISGREEARLIYLGVSSGLHLNDSTVMFIDIGGGSTEIVVGNQYEHFELDSLKLGAIRLTSMFFLPDEDGPVADDRYALLQRYVRNAIARSLPRLRGHAQSMTVGSSGTIENLADIASRQYHNRPRNRDDVLTLPQVVEIGAMLRALPLAERGRVPGINAARADIIVAGVAILETLMQELGADELRVSDRGLREGLIIDHLARAQPGLLRAMTVRQRSVLGLGRACGFDEDHARTVARIALELFDSAHQAGLHELGGRERELLEHASMLHDIGTFLSSSGHQQHTYYLIRNADMLGFDREEIELIAAVARFHRKGFPSKKHVEYRALRGQSRRLVRPLAMFLRMAESLDRSRSGLVLRASLTPVVEVPVGSGDSGTGERSGKCAGARPTARGVELRLAADQEPQLELWGAEAHVESFERTFGRKLVVRWVAVTSDQVAPSQ